MASKNASLQRQPGDEGKKIFVYFCTKQAAESKY